MAIKTQLETESLVSEYFVVPVFGANEEEEEI